MKKQSIFCALMSLMAMGVSTSCTNVDNPYAPTTPDTKYVVVKDSVITSDGDVYVYDTEFDAEGKAVKETYTYYYEDGTTDQEVCCFTYGPDLITGEETLSDGTTSYAYFRLNSKGLVEHYERASYGIDVRFKYSDDGHVNLVSTPEFSDSLVWKDDDVVSWIYKDRAVDYVMTDYEIDFPFLMPFDGYDTVLSQLGYFGKPTRHLVSKLAYESEDENGYNRASQSFDYVVRNGLVMEFTMSAEAVSTAKDLNESYIVHHYLTWKKL